jgi:hypothetical protein
MIEVAKHNQERRTEMIVPVESEICQSVRQFFELEGKVEVARPSRCLRPKEECGSLDPLRKNGTYPRQVIYWGMLFVLAILRFRCGKCGRTVSRPLNWLVPYKRFSAEMIDAGVEAYVAAENSYRKVSDAVSEPEFVEEKEDIRQTKLYSELSAKNAIEPAVTKDGGSRPSHCAVFRWVDYLCKRIEWILRQLQKELVRRQKDLRELPREGSVENPNSLKAQTDTKAQRLDRLSFAGFAARLLIIESEKRWWQLRAYFLRKAENCKDLLTDTRVRCQ